MGVTAWTLGNNGAERPYTRRKAGTISVPARIENAFQLSRPSAFRSASRSDAPNWALMSGTARSSS